MQAVFYYLTLIVILAILGFCYGWIDRKVPKVTNVSKMVLFILIGMFCIGFMGWYLPELVHSYLVKHPDFHMKDPFESKISDVPYLARVFKVIFVIVLLAIFFRGFYLWIYFMLIGLFIYGVVYGAIWLFQ